MLFRSDDDPFGWAFINNELLEDGHRLSAEDLLKLLYISLIFAVLDVMHLAVFSCCTCQSFPAYVSTVKSGCVQC